MPSFPCDSKLVEWNALRGGVSLPLDHGFHLGGVFSSSKEGDEYSLEVSPHSYLPCPFSNFRQKPNCSCVNYCNWLPQSWCSELFSATSKISDGQRNLIISKSIWCHVPGQHADQYGIVEVGHGFWILARFVPGFASPMFLHLVVWTLGHQLMVVLFGEGLKPWEVGYS